MKWTTENLQQHALKPVMQWLVWAAHNQSTVSYGQAAEWLVDMGFESNRFGALRVGETVPGRIMPTIHTCHGTGVPPLNVLLVKTREPRLPGIGVCRDLAIWHGVDANKKKRLRSTTKRYEEIANTDSDEWKRICYQAMSAVYTYADWEAVFHNVWGQDLEEMDTEDLENPLAPQEPDGVNFPGGGEGERHRSLREWIMRHPEVIDARYRNKQTGTEWLLKSGDRVDVVIYLPRGETVPVEVKSCVSNEADLERGVYQCVRYRSVIDAMGMNARAVLVTEKKLPRHLRSLANDHDVEHVQVKRSGRGFRVGAPSGPRRGRSPETVFGMLSRPDNPSLSIEELSESTASGWAGEV